MKIGDTVKVLSNENRLQPGTIAKVVEVVRYRDDDPYCICVGPVEGRTWVWYRPQDLEILTPQE